MTLGATVAEAWLKLWETIAAHIPLPRGLADFTVALIISTILVLIHRYNKRLCYAVLLVLAGAILLSILVYITAPL